MMRSLKWSWVRCLAFGMFFGMFLSQSCSDENIVEGENINPPINPSGEPPGGTPIGGGGTNGEETGGPATNGDFNVGDACIRESYTQVSDGTNIIDILVVVDTSGSMSEELKTVGSQFRSFLNVLLNDYPNLDYQFAVMLAHAESPQSGVLWQPSQCTNPPIIHGTSSSNYVTDIDPLVRCKLEHFVQASEAESKGEAGIFSLVKATSQNLSTFKSAGFFRPDAGVAVIFVADENEICHAPPGYKEGDNEEAVFRKSEKCGGKGPLVAYSQLKSIQQTAPLILAGLLNLNSKNSNYGWGYLGTTATLGYMGILNLAGGDSVATAISQTPSQISDALAMIGNKASFSLKRKVSFPLRTGTLKVESVVVNGSTVPFQFNSNSSEVTIDPTVAGKPGDSIVVHSCIR